VQLSNAVRSQLHEAGHVLTLPLQPVDGVRSWSFEGWTILGSGNHVSAGITLRAADLSPWNINIPKLKSMGLKLRV